MADWSQRDRIYQLYIPADKREIWVKLRDKYQNQLAPMIRELVNEKIDEWLAENEVEGGSEVEQLKKSLKVS